MGNDNNIRENYKIIHLKKICWMKTWKLSIVESYRNHVHCLTSGVNCITFKKSVTYSIYVIYEYPYT